MTTRNIGLAIASVLAFSAGVTAEEFIRPGVLICRAGYVMDSYRIANGYLVTRPDVKALEGPNLYAVSSLVDIEESVASAFHILEPPAGGSTMYSPGTEVTNNQVLVDLARSVGVCETCGGGGGTSYGFEAEVVGMVMSMAPLTIEVREARIPVMGHECSTFYTSPPTTPGPTEAPVTPSPTQKQTVAPTLSPTIRTPSPTKGPTESPTSPPNSSPPTKSPTMAPTMPAPSSSPTVSPSYAPSSSPTSLAPKTPGPLNCSEYQETFEVPDLPEVTIRHVVNIDEKDSTKSTLSAQVIYEGQGWLGFGISPNGGMNGSHVVIGSVEESDFIPVNPGKYYLGGHASEFVTLKEEQTLVEETIMQNDTHTVLTFTTYLQEEGQPSINGNGTNRFIVAIGSDNEFAYHDQRTSFVMELTPCISEPFNPLVNVTGNYTDGNWTDIGDIIFDGEGNPDAIPFDGDESGFGPIGVGVAQGRSAGRSGNNMDSMLSDEGISDEVSSAVAFRCPALILGLTGVVAMFL